MKTKSILVAILVVLWFGLPEVMAIILNDGEIHNIDYFVNDEIGIDYGMPGMQTTVNWLEGASSSYRVTAYEDSRLNVLGGSIGNNIIAFDRSQVHISGGLIIDVVHAHGNSYVEMTDGTIVNHLMGFDNSQVNMSGGSLGSEFYAWGNSCLTLSGGVVGDNVASLDRAKLFLYSGSVNNGLYVNDNSEAYFHGGTVGSGFEINSEGVLTIYGFNFAIDGNPIGYTEIVSLFGGRADNEPLRHLTGTLYSGEFIDNDFHIGNNGKIILIPEPATPPVADADGPYTVFVGDVLTLDGSGSIDDDNDIVSYIWDIDDNNSFETDAGEQAVFDVNYTELESLGLLVNHTYNIHLKVTDSEQQSDVNDSTLTIVPKPALAVSVDIKPGSCPNPLNVKSSGVLPVAILGTADYDVTTIDPTSIRLAGVEPLRSGYEDVATPVLDANDCNCTTEGPDGYLDLTLKFETAEIVDAIGEVNDGDVLTLELTGVLFGERPIEGADCILIRGRHKPFNSADINKDGVVDMLDFAAVADNWLQSSIIED